MDFARLQKDGLKDECAKRGLPVSGTNLVLLLRLKEYEEYKKSQDSRSPQSGLSGRNNSLPNRSRPAAPPQIGKSGRTDLSDLTEAELEQICHNSFLPKYVSDQISQRDAEIQTEFNVKRDEASKKREESIKRAENKYAKDVEKLVKERDGKLDEIKEDRDKQRNWLPAFGRLRDLKLVHGVRIHPHDFDPSRRRPAPPSIVPSPPASSPLNSQAAAFRNSRVPSPSVASTATMRSTATIATSSTMITATTPSNKRRASEMDDNEDTIYRTAPSGPRAQFRGDVDRISSFVRYRSQLSNNTSYIFISAGNISVQYQYIDDMYDMLRKERFDVSKIRGDPDGYFWIFDTRQGDVHAALCYQHFQGRLFGNTRMELELRLRIAGGA